MPRKGITKEALGAFYWASVPSDNTVANKTDTIDKRAARYLPIRLYGYGAGVTMGSANLRQRIHPLDQHSKGGWMMDGWQQVQCKKGTNR